jgi:phosphopantothenoylcysteine decarboxylase/phosphopantothenate--cysteine ligase
VEAVMSIKLSTIALERSPKGRSPAGPSNITEASITMTKAKQIVLGVTASIAIYKACELVRRLQDERMNVIAVMTPGAEALIRPIVFQSLTGNRVYRGMFDEPDAWEIEHIALAQKADAVLIAPATANIIGKISGGICDDLLTCTVCATEAPVLICPAMNEHMYRNKIVQANIKKLKALGYRFVEPIKGRLAWARSGSLFGGGAVVKAVKYT